ncbi:hypothetical protein AAVH_18402, partial [Aphelenchoides avenae]
ELERKLLRTNAAALQDSQKRIDLLEQQLHQLDIEVTALRIENKELQGLGDASWALETEEPSGPRPSLIEVIKTHGFYQDDQSHLQRCTQPILNHRYGTSGSIRYS